MVDQSSVPVGLEDETIVLGTKLPFYHMVSVENRKTKVEIVHKCGSKFLEDVYDEFRWEVVLVLRRFWNPVEAFDEVRGWFGHRGFKIVLEPNICVCKSLEAFAKESAKERLWHEV